jgi:hypothetical protein
MFNNYNQSQIAVQWRQICLPSLMKLGWRHTSGGDLLALVVDEKVVVLLFTNFASVVLQWPCGDSCEERHLTPWRNPSSLIIRQPFRTNPQISRSKTVVFGIMQTV